MTATTRRRFLSELDAAHDAIADAVESDSISAKLLSHLGRRLAALEAARRPLRTGKGA